MSPLPRRMIEDMAIRKLTAKTQQGYIRIVKDFAAFLGPGCSPTLAYRGPMLKKCAGLPCT